MSIVNELISVEAFVKARSPTSNTVKQTVPLKPVANTFVIRLQSSSSESETAYHFRNDRDYQIVYYGATALDVLTKIDALSTALYQTKLIAIVGSQRYIRVNSAAATMPFVTDNELHAVILVVTTEIREVRTQQEYEKIAHVYTGITVQAALI